METPIVAPTTDLLERMRDAIDDHDLEALAACFHLEFNSTFPAHPGRAFTGQAQMRKNWAQIFAAVPDIQSRLLCSAANDDTAWSEWEWSGTRRDGAAFAMRGVTIQGIFDGRIAWARLYMEPVEEGADTESALKQAIDPQHLS